MPAAYPLGLEMERSSSSGAGGAAEKTLYEQVIDALKAIFGSHPGYRPVDTKGVICEGTFRGGIGIAESRHQRFG